MIGFLNVNKPVGISSHKIVSLLRKITGIKQIGHAGTLDPIASGVLPIAIGKASKLIDYLPTDKRYIASLEFGKKSDTYDIEGKVEIINNSQPVKKEEVEEVLPSFRGKIKQIPPVYSAVHYKGKRLYELARNGKIPDDIPNREVIIYKNELLDFNEIKQYLKLDITCSKGTYIRSIVNDIGLMLNTGAVMCELIRTFSSGMDINNSIIIDENTPKEYIEKNLINPVSLLSLKNIEINDIELKTVKNGNKIKTAHNNIYSDVILTYKGELIALSCAEENFIQPKKLLI